MGSAKESDTPGPHENDFRNISGPFFDIFTKGFRAFCTFSDIFHNAWTPMGVTICGNFQPQISISRIILTGGPDVEGRIEKRGTCHHIPGLGNCGPLTGVSFSNRKWSPACRLQEPPLSWSVEICYEITTNQLTRPDLLSGWGLLAHRGAKASGEKDHHQVHLCLSYA